MSYEDAMYCGAVVSRKEAELEIIKGHGCSFDEFLQECGDREEYEAADVLIWLGY